MGLMSGGNSISLTVRPSSSAVLVLGIGREEPAHRLSVPGDTFRSVRRLAACRVNNMLD